MAKSGIVDDVAEQAGDDRCPTPMPASATPTGRPMASTEPKARIRMTMAKPGRAPRTTGASNSAKTAPPSSTRSPSTSGIAARISSADVDGLLERWRRPELDLGVGDLPASVALGGDLALAARRRRGWTTRLHAVDARRPRRRAPPSPARTSGSSTPASASNTMLPPWPAPMPPKWSSRMSMPRLLSTSGSVNSERDSVPTAPITAPRSTMPRTQTSSTRVRRRKERAAKRCIRLIARSPGGRCCFRLSSYERSEDAEL